MNEMKCLKGAITPEEIPNVFDIDDTCMHCENCMLIDGLVLCKYNKEGDGTNDNIIC